MGKSDDSSTTKKKTTRKQAPARTKEAREQQLENLAMNLAEEKLRNGTASSQIICHFLNLATEKAELDREKVRADVKLQNAKVDAIESQKQTEEMYAKAIAAMQRYQGHMDDSYDDY